MLEKYPRRVNLVLKHFPLRQHRAARAAAQAALAAARQGKYVELSDLMFRNHTTLDEERIETFARQVGLDMARFAEDFNGAAVSAIIEADIDLGRRIRIRGVPALYVDGRAVKDYSLGGISRVIEKRLSKAPATTD